MSRIFKGGDERDLRDLVLFCETLRRGLTRVKAQANPSTQE